MGVDVEGRGGGGGCDNWEEIITSGATCEKARCKMKEKMSESMMDPEIIDDGQGYGHLVLSCHKPAIVVVAGLQITDF